MITDARRKCLHSLMKTVIPQGLYGSHHLFPASESKAWKVFKDQIVRCLFSIKKSSHREKTKERIPVRDERSRRLEKAVFQGPHDSGDLVSAQSDGGSLSSGNVTRLICLNHTSLDVSAGRRCHSSSASLPAAGKLETFKQDGRTEKRSPLVQRRRCVERCWNMGTNIQDSITDRQKCKCSGNWLLSMQIRCDNCLAHCHQTVRTHSFIPAPPGVLVFVQRFATQHSWKIILAALS